MFRSPMFQANTWLLVLRMQHQKALAPREYYQLLAFLQKGPDTLSPVPREQLYEEVDNMLQEFYQTKL